MAKEPEPFRRITALKVRQWLEGWDKISFDAKEHRKKPQPHFFIFSLRARELRSLSGIARRTISGATPRAADLGIQRQHDPERSAEIKQFVEYGFPWSTLSGSKRESTEFHDLRKPGWLPTAIVVNILEPTQRRPTGPVNTDDLIKVEDEGEICRIVLPYSKWTSQWRATGTPPIEVIDGQHRLWSFENANTDFELPVVAFYGLDISWQAYLFWTINIKPKRINPSLAFDLYPLLRTEDWLDRGEGHEIYRDTRSQEITEALWAHPDSPWFRRINMLGERGNRWVTQAAWIKSLTSTFIRRWAVTSAGQGGLFGSRMQDGDEVLNWSRAQQAAFLIYAWERFRFHVQNLDEGWAKKLRIDAMKEGADGGEDPAFYGRFSLIATDQGVRGFLHVLNDICFVWATRLELRTWRIDRQAGASDTDGVTLALATLRKHPLSKFVNLFVSNLTRFDWRASSAPDLNDIERRAKLVFRGSSGYRELRSQLVESLREGDDEVADAAKRL